LIAQSVLPVATLPNAAFSSAETALGDFLVVWKSTRELCLYEAPARGEIRIALGQCPNGMQMVRQDHGRFDRKWMSLPCVAMGRPQQLDVSVTAVGDRPN